MLKSKSFLGLALIASLAACNQSPFGGSAQEQQGSPGASSYALQQFRPLPHNFPRELLLPLRLEAGSEQSILKYLNNERKKVGAPPLTLDTGSLQQAAREHSWQMGIQRRGFLVGPDGKSIEDRLKEANATYGVHYGYAWGPERVGDPFTMPIYVTAHLDRQALQDARYRRVGVAVYRRVTGDVLSERLYTTLILAD